MFSFARTKTHERLRSRMSDTLGVDLEEAQMRGQMSDDAMAQASVRCTSCGDASACAEWLDTQTDTAASPPDFCRNARLFQNLMLPR